MAYINWPPLEDLLANPNKYGSFFTTPGPDGYSIVSRMQSFPSEAQANYNTAKAQVQTQIDRALNEVYNAMNNGTAYDPQKSQNARYYWNNAKSILDGVSSSAKGDSFPSYDQMIGKAMKDPQGTGQVVDASGKVVEPSKMGQQPPTGTSSTPASGSTTSGSSTTPPGSSGGSSQSKPDLQLPSGQRISASDPSYDAYVKQGVKPAPDQQSSTSSGAGSSGSTSSGAPKTMDDIRKQLTDAGFNVNGYPDDMLMRADLLWQTMKKNAEIDKQIVPDSLSEADMKKYLDKAHDYLDPYYKEQTKLFSQDIAQQAGFLSGDVAQAQQQQAQAFKQQQEDVAAQAAEAGLAQSGIRRKAEEQLKMQQEGAVSSSRRQLQQQINTLGQQAERTLGTQGMGDITSKLAIGGQQYTPQGVQYGGIQEQQKVADKAKGNELAQQAYQKAFQQGLPRVA